MVRELVRLRTPFAEVTLVRRGDPRAANGLVHGSALTVKGELDRWLENPQARAALVRLAGLGGRPMTDAVVHRARNHLLHALDRGDIVALQSRIRRVIMSSPSAKASIGPDEPAPLGESFLWAVLFDAAGAPISDALGVTYDALEHGKARFENLRLRAGGAGVPALPVGAPLSYDLKFTIPDDLVPITAAPLGPPRFDLARVNAKGPVGEAVRVTRRELAKKTQAGALDINNVFQLRRRKAEVIEFEHFHDGSAVFLPGRAPESVYRDGITERPLGVDVLTACLTLAAGHAPEQMVITGHGPNVSQERADAIKALLVGDDVSRTAWVAIAVATAVPDDVVDILRWAAGAFGWACDPDAPRGRSLAGAIQELKIDYNADVRAGLFPAVSRQAPLLEDGVLDPPTWGAIFDCIVRALRPPRAVGLPPWAKYPEGDARTRTGVNAGRPQGQHAFVVAGTNGPGNAPITIAQYGGGDQNLAFTVFQGVNPQYRVGVDPEFVGQALNVPDDWADALAAAGYTVERDPLPPPAAPEQEGPPPLPAPGPRAVGCGAHHLTAPFMGAEGRRAEQRHAEVALFEAAEAPLDVACGRGSGPCPASHCELYDPREFMLAYDSVPASRIPGADAGVIFMELFEDLGVQPLAGRRYRIECLSAARPALTGTIGADGRLRHEHVAPGDYVIQVDGRNETSSALVLTANSSPQVRFLG